MSAHDGDDSEPTEMELTTVSKHKPVDEEAQTAQQTELAPTTTGDDAAAPAAPNAPPPKVPWHKKRWVRIVAVRVVLRLGMIGLVILLGFLFKPRKIVDTYVDWIDSFSSQGVAMLVFTCICSLFSAVMPGSYAPVALAGATFGALPGWGLGYVLLNVGSMLNMFVIRLMCRPFCAKKCARRIDRMNINVLEVLFQEQPIRTVFMMRLPVIGSGILNYVFSLSHKLSAKHVLVGNLSGWVLGSLMFSFLGTRVRSIGAAILDGEGGTASLILSILSLVLVMVCAFTVAFWVRKSLRTRARSRSLSGNGAELDIPDFPPPAPADKEKKGGASGESGGGSGAGTSGGKYVAPVTTAGSEALATAHDSPTAITPTAVAPTVDAAHVQPAAPETV